LASSVSIGLDLVFVLFGQRGTAPEGQDGGRQGHAALGRHLEYLLDLCSDLIILCLTRLAG
jgi:hypothetical protein